MHPLYLANATKQIACTAPLVQSIDDMIEKVRKQREMQQGGEWIEGWGYDERISVGKAIELYTRAAQEVTLIPDVGQLKPGFHADFIILDQDILEIPSDKINQVKVEETYLGGKRVYQKPTCQPEAQTLTT